MKIWKSLSITNQNRTHSFQTNYDMAENEIICVPFQKMIQSLNEEESISNVEPPMLVDEGEKDSELFNFFIEYFECFPGFDLADISEEESIFPSLPNCSEQIASDADFLARMDDMLALVDDDNMDLAELVVDWVLCSIRLLVLLKHEDIQDFDE